jgi:hypothetical protein
VAWLARDPGGAFPGAQMTLEHRAAVPPSIGYDELVQDIMNGGAKDAIARLRASYRIEDDRPSALGQAGSPGTVSRKLALYVGTREGSSAVSSVPGRALS